MTNPIAFFFVLLAISLLISGFYLPKLAMGKRGNNFGMGLIFSGICFGILGYAVTLGSLESVNRTVTVGLASLMLGMLFFLRSGTQHLSRGGRRSVLIAAATYILILAIIRVYYPTNPDFIGSGLFFFNPHPLVKFMEIILFTGVLVPASLCMMHEIRIGDRISGNAFYIAIITIQVSLVVLLASSEDFLIMLDAVAISLALLLLMLTALGFFRRRRIKFIAFHLHQFYRNRIAPRLEALKHSERIS